MQLLARIPCGRDEQTCSMNSLSRCVVYKIANTAEISQRSFVASPPILRIAVLLVRNSFYTLYHLRHFNSLERASLYDMQWLHLLTERIN